MARRKTYSRADLDSMTSKVIKKMAYNQLGISGLSKLGKDAVVDAVLAHQDGGAAVAPKAKASGPIKGIQFSGSSVVSNPSAPFGQKTTTTIHVSCGASSGSFPVQGKTVREVGELPVWSMVKKRMPDMF